MTQREQLRHYILENYLFTSDASALDDDASFLERGIIDSTGIMEVIDFLEERFGVQVRDEEMVPENLDSVNRICRFLERKRAAA